MEAFREAFKAAKPCLLEPILDVEIKVPEQYLGDVLGDISSRRGRIQGVDAEEFAHYEFLPGELESKVMAISETFRKAAGHH